MRKNPGNVLLTVLVAVSVAAASVGGYFWWSSQKPKEVTPSVDKMVYTEVSRSANWKTYISPLKDFQIMYPPNWVYRERPVKNDPIEVVTFGSKVSEELISITLEKIQSDKLISIYDRNIAAQEVSGQEKTLTKNNFVVGDLNGTKFVDDGYPGIQKVYLFIGRGGETYSIIGVTKDPEHPEAKNVESILSTFKFLETNKESVGDRCRQLGRGWSEKYRECSVKSEKECKQLGGRYDFCASACRHDPNAQLCTTQCVQVCSF